MAERPSTDEAPATLPERIQEAIWYLEDQRERPAFVISVVGLGALIVLIALWAGRSRDARPIEDVLPQVSLATTVPSMASPIPLIVHVAGMVARPGVYELAAGSRVIDAVEAAGGPTPGGEVGVLNLAAPLTDGVQIWVPAEGEVPRPSPMSGSRGPNEPVGPIDVNSASLDQLDSLPGVGPATANAILAYREEHGPFATLDDLLGVPGIGPAKLAAIADAAVAR